MSRFKKRSTKEANIIQLIYNSSQREQIVELKHMGRNVAAPLLF